MASASTSTAASIARRRRQLTWLAALLLVILVGGSVALFLYDFPVSGSSPNPTEQAALSYARQQMVWNSGPTVQSVHVVRLGKIEPVLAANLPAHVVKDITVSDLIQRFGAHRQVAVVVLSGVFNTLPPDEGIVVHGNAVVLVDVRTQRAIYIND
jgi:hypothetical protein